MDREETYTGTKSKKRARNPSERNRARPAERRRQEGSASRGTPIRTRGGEKHQDVSAALLGWKDTIYSCPGLRAVPGKGEKKRKRERNGAKPGVRFGKGGMP